MPEEKNATNPVTATDSATSPIVEPVVPSNPAVAAAPEVKVADNTEIQAEVAQKINQAHNVLIALSSDPSVDEMAAAIGLSLFLEKTGKRATAIYSGSTPNALKFLKPEETFEPSVDTLQDFVVALNKEKADHLRYKLDGDFVKIYITPYKSRIGEEDLDFSYGDYNVDLVLALDVANGVDLDSALREHGRIMHDAVIVNITTGNPGKLGEVEWSDKNASSVSEMIAQLLYKTGGDTKIEKEEATAFLTGIVAATNRFANAKTTSETMKLASRLIDSGANQQLVSKNITPDVENEMAGFQGLSGHEQIVDTDPTKLDVMHEDEAGAEPAKEVSDTITEKKSTLLDDLKAAEASLAGAGTETVQEEAEKPLEISSEGASTPEVSTPEVSVSEAMPVMNVPEVSMPGVNMSEVAPAVSAPEMMTETSAPEAVVPAETNTSAVEMPGAETPAVEMPEVEMPGPEVSAPGMPADETPETVGPMGATETTGSIEPAESTVGMFSQPEKVVQPLSGMDGLGAFEDGGADKYGQMLEDALENSNSTAGASTGAEGAVSGIQNTDGLTGGFNPAVASAPTVATTPEINGVPEINYMPMPGEEVLPPPPTPPIDMNAEVAPAMNVDATTAPITPATPVVQPAPESLGAQPSMQDQVYHPQAADPSAFKLPGM